MSETDAARLMVRGHLAGVLLAVRELLDSIALSRPDGETFARAVRCGRTRIVICERSGTVGIGIAGEKPGDPCQWIETINAIPGNDAEFGQLLSQAVKPAEPMH